MRFCRFDDDRYGVVVGDKVHDITDAVAKTLSGKKKQRWGDPMIANLAEVRAAVAAAHQVAPGMPVVATMSFDTNLRTMMGVTPRSEEHTSELQSH